MIVDIPDSDGKNYGSLYYTLVKGSNAISIRLMTLMFCLFFQTENLI